MFARGRSRGKHLLPLRRRVRRLFGAGHQTKVAHRLKVRRRFLDFRKYKWSAYAIETATRVFDEKCSAA